MGENKAFHGFPFIDWSNVHTETTRVDPRAPQCYNGTEFSGGPLFYSGHKDPGHKETWKQWEWSQSTGRGREALSASVAAASSSPGKRPSLWSWRRDLKVCGNLTSPGPPSALTGWQRSSHPDWLPYTKSHRSLWVRVRKTFMALCFFFFWHFVLICASAPS